MRIIAGQRRGHKIDGPRPSASTKPSSDLVRESLFNILDERVVDCEVIDGVTPVRAARTVARPPETAAGDDQTDQSSITRPGTWVKSRRLAVTRTHRFARAVAAIFRSWVPMRIWRIRWNSSSTAWS